MARSRQELEALLNDPNARGGLDMIARAEGTAQYDNNGYNTQYTGRQFSGDQHPNMKIQGSTAAGRYQFLNSTWNGLARQYGFENFSPQNQDVGALALLDQLGALDDVLKGDYNAAIPKIKNTWVAFQKGGDHSGGGPLSSAPSLGSAMDAQVPEFDPNSFFNNPGVSLLKMITPQGTPGVALAQSQEDMNLFSKFQAYDEELRGKLMALSLKIDEAESILRASLFSSQPSVYDQQLLALLSKV